MNGQKKGPVLGENQGRGKTEIENNSILPSSAQKLQVLCMGVA